MSNNTMTQAELERLLDVYGSDRTRWPVEARAGAGQLAARDSSARLLLQEAEALDRVLDRAPLPSLMSEAALADRIVAAAQRSPRMIKGGVRAAVAPEHQSGNLIQLPLRRARSLSSWLSGTEMGRAAAVLAASLTIGVFIGLSNVSEAVVPALADITGITLESSTAYNLAQIEPFDEDML
jgi:hypothetical protein